MYKARAFLEIIFKNDSFFTCSDPYRKGENGEDLDADYLNIDFEIDSDAKKNEAAGGIFRVYNMNETNRNRTKRDVERVKLTVGYFDPIDNVFNSRMVYVGSVVNVDNFFDHSECSYVTEIQAGDGFKQFTQSFTSKSWAGGVEKKVIAQAVAKDFGIDTRISKGILEGKTTTAQVFCNPTKQALELFLRDNGCEFKIIDEVTTITKKNEPTDDNVILLNADTGLLESPIVNSDGDIELEAQLHLDMRVNRKFKLESKNISGEKKIRSFDYNGFYVCRSLKMVGDNYATGSFNMNIVAKRL